MSTLQLRRVNKAFDETHVIHDVDLNIADGEFVVFVGPSGCGKSTLLRMIAGLEKTTSGDIVLDGEVVNHVTAADRGLAMVFQSYALYPHMSVYQNMAFGLENSRMPKPEIEERVGQAARLLQIDELLRRKPRQLSGGQRQRVAIGRAIVRQPKIFLFDEPLSNLDAELRVQMRSELIRLHGRLEATMIYVTHDQVEAMTMADKIVVLREGNVEQVGAPLDLYNDPANRFVAGFIGSPRMNFLNGRVADIEPDGVILDIGGVGKIKSASAGNGVSRGDEIALGIRPEHVQTGSNGANVAEVKVNFTEQLGSESYLYCELPTLADLTIHVSGQTQVRESEKIKVSFPADLCHVFRSDGAETALPRLS